MNPSWYGKQGTMHKGEGTDEGQKARIWNMAGLEGGRRVVELWPRGGQGNVSRGEKRPGGHVLGKDPEQEEMGVPDQARGAANKAKGAAALMEQMQLRGTTSSGLLIWP